MSGDPGNLAELINWLSAGGSAIVMAMLVSFLAEHSATFQAWTPTQKLMFHVLGSLLVGAAAFAVVQFVPAETLALLAPWWRMAFISVSAALGNQLWHKATA